MMTMMTMMMIIMTMMMIIMTMMLVGVSPTRYGKVFQVAYKKTREILALKAVKKCFMSKEQAARTMTERSIMAEVSFSD